ncbi:MAG: HD domain-containing protein [Chloroflexota bacterium]
MSDERLLQQIEFINEVEKLKLVTRHNVVIDNHRPENSAEHSWHIALMAIVLLEHADLENIDLLRVLKMLILHDLVEIYAGDTWIYDEAGSASQHERELEAAHKLFSLLPSDQKSTFLSLWLEFEARESDDAIFAASIDTLQPLQNRWITTPPDAGIEPPTTQQVINKKKHIADASSKLWQYAQQVIKKSAEAGFYTIDSSFADRHKHESSSD